MWNNWNSKKKNVQLFIFLSNNFIYFYNNLQCVYFYNSILYQLIEMLLSSVFLCTQYKISIFKFNETTNKRNDIFSLSYYYYLISTKIFHEIIFHHSSISKIYYHQKNGAIKLKKKKFCNISRTCKNNVLSNSYYQYFIKIKIPNVIN